MAEPSPDDRARLVLIGVRTALAAATWTIPRSAGRLFGIPVAENPAAPYLARLYGARSAFMAASLLTTTPSRAPELMGQHALVDAADIVASVIATQRGELTARGGWTTGLTALGLFLLGLRAVAGRRSETAREVR